MGHVAAGLVGDPHEGTLDEGADAGQLAETGLTTLFEPARRGA